MAHPPQKPSPPDTTAQDWKQLHLWQIQPVRDTLLVAGVLGLLYLGYILSPVTVPLLLAMALAYLFEPLVRALTRSGALTRPLVAIGIIAVTGVVIVVPATLGVGFAVGQGVKVAQRVATNADALSFALQHPDDAEARAKLVGAGRSWVEIYDYVVTEQRKSREWEAWRAAAAAGEPPQGDQPPEPSDIYRVVQAGIGWVRENAAAIGKGMVNVGGGAIGATFNLMGWVGRLLFGAFLTAFFFYFCCTGWGRVLAFWEGLIPGRKRGRVVELLAQMDRVIAGFVRGRLTICGVLMLLYTLCFWLIGVPAPLILGPVVGVLTIVPYASGGVGIPLAIVLLWLEAHPDFRGQWWWVLGAPVAVSTGLQLLDDYVLTPRIQGEATKMDTPSILFASIAGGVLAGFYGILLAIPAAACIKILLKEVFWPRFRAWGEGKAKDFLPIGKD
jgi:predicted PurR-regulated permease PerM